MSSAFWRLASCAMELTFWRSALENYYGDLGHKTQPLKLDHRSRVLNN